MISLEATYLLWIDCGNVCGFSNVLAEYIREKTGLFLTAGTIYGKNGDHFMRMNVACTRKNLEDGLTRLKTGIMNYQEWMKTNC